MSTTLDLFSPVNLGAIALKNCMVMVRANTVIASGHADAIAFGVPFIANPDLVERFRIDAPLNTPDSKSFYGSNKQGYTDYPFLGA